jgi:hypothetical protein
LLVLVLALMLDRARTNAMRQPIVVLLLFLLLVLVPVPVLHAGSGPIATDPTRNTCKTFPTRLGSLAQNRNGRTRRLALCIYRFNKKQL